ncbi:non-hydrolyzing UDP-N-acetylglucosamine 2-epimerase [Mechercharimyces sp. CAU 1602]|uniref:non-hydrolyzing UDP-N-acetylglucosamine 2-epimerase n=1 Tax=Mechercharimyces sp. CAU 1602 TaxID=2973933 RepID=UPI0021638067|nr:UDP-N-acetylglucosamine 2-epimerase (non-hydrolyzing) [Mechercharimyces sp. CAU 1602]MCS1350003.1 UDP-N-acetylglucosamine 2-epimerase (non-hydrolyzing) [Mechercharimyces sp. CAU 1602]
MTPFRILIVFGTRPEAMKMAPLVKALRLREEWTSYICVTSQHQVMLNQVMNAFSLKADFDLDVMEEEQSLTSLTMRLLQRLEPVMQEVKPDLVLVHGDTTTSFVASIVASYFQIPVGHVEAGLRTTDLRSPFPEEMNRRLTGVIAQLHFAPTQRAAANLYREGKSRNQVYITGNTIIDAFATTVRKEYSHPLLQNIKDKQLVLVTAHRRESWGEAMRKMFESLRRLIDEVSSAVILFPVHLNPQVKLLAEKVLGGHERIHLIPPLCPLHFHNLLQHAHLVCTDSGGIQEEAPSFKVPVLVMRERTERPEAVEAGVAKLVGTDGECLYTEAKQLLIDRKSHENMITDHNPFGDGEAAQRICDAIAYHFGFSDVRPPCFVSSLCK